MARVVLIFYAVLSTQLCSRDFASSLRSSLAPERACPGRMRRRMTKNRPHSVVIWSLRDCGRSRNKVTEFRKKSLINHKNAVIFYFLLRFLCGSEFEY
jgi:hypothetical protein